MTTGRSGEVLTPASLGIGRLFWAIREAVVVADAATGAIVLWNPAAEAMFGFPAEEAVGRPVEVLVPDRLKFRHREGMKKFAASGHGLLVDADTPIELPALRKDGSEIVVELSLSPMRDVPVSGTYVLAVIRDVTERKQAEEIQVQLIQARAARAEAEAAMKVHDELLAAISHDLKSPLATISTSAQFLQRRAARIPEAAPLKEGLDRICAGAIRMVRMVDDLLDMVSQRTEPSLALERELVDLVQLVRRMASDQLRQTSRHHVRVETSEASVLGSWDVARLERVVENLLANAIKYSPRGGEVVLWVGRRVEAGKPVAVLVVRDQGVGIPADDLPYIFERFRRGANVTGHFSGTGIGLASARHLVELHGGHISAESEEGSGSTFTVVLPLEESASGPA